MRNLLIIFGTTIIWGLILTGSGKLLEAQPMNIDGQAPKYHAEVPRFQEIDPQKMFTSRVEFLKAIFRWEVEEVPRNVTVYMDMARDGYIDFVWAFPIQTTGFMESCNPLGFPKERKDTLIFNTCETTNMKHIKQYYLTNTSGWVCNTCPLLHMGQGNAYSVQTWR